MKRKNLCSILAALCCTVVLCAEGAEIKFVQEYIYPTEFTVTPIYGRDRALPGGATTGGRSIGAIVEPGGFETREVGVVMSVEAYVADLGGGNAALLSLQQELQDTKSTPLMVAAASGNTDEVKRLLRRPANVNAKNTLGSTALMGAAAGGYEDIVGLLLQRKALLNVRSKDGGSPLIFASKNGHAGVVRMLLKKGARHNVPDKRGATALMYAVANGHTEAARFLIAAGANVNFRNRHGLTPLKIAQQTENKELVALLARSGARKR